jgi:hypothetical protein
MSTAELISRIHGLTQLIRALAVPATRGLGKDRADAREVIRKWAYERMLLRRELDERRSVLCAVLQRLLVEISQIAQARGFNCIHSLVGISLSATEAMYIKDFVCWARVRSLILDYVNQRPTSQIILACLSAWPPEAARVSNWGTNVGLLATQNGPAGFRDPGTREKMTQMAAGLAACRYRVWLAYVVRCTISEISRLNREWGDDSIRYILGIARLIAKAIHREVYVDLPGAADRVADYVLKVNAPLISGLKDVEAVLRAIG